MGKIQKLDMREVVTMATSLRLIFQLSLRAEGF